MKQKTRRLLIARWILIMNQTTRRLLIPLWMLIMIKRCVILNGIYIIDVIKVKQLFSLKQASRSSTKLKSDAEPFLAQCDKVENDKQMFEIVIPVSKVHVYMSIVSL